LIIVSLRPASSRLDLGFLRQSGPGRFARAPQLNRRKTTYIALHKNIKLFFLQRTLTPSGTRRASQNGAFVFDLI
jgi:hypothetical protein